LPVHQAVASLKSPGFRRESQIIFPLFRAIVASSATAQPLLYISGGPMQPFF
jgi:hypothetical protein